MSRPRPKRNPLTPDQRAAKALKLAIELQALSETGAYYLDCINRIQRRAETVQREYDRLKNGQEPGWLDGINGVDLIEALKNVEPLRGIN